jgi:hypothetical protein
MNCNCRDGGAWNCDAAAQDRRDGCLVNGATQAAGNFQMNGMNCVCNRDGSWNCASPPVVAQALAENGNTLAASSGNSDSAMPSYGVVLIVLGALVLVMLLVVVIQLVALIRS